MGGWWPLVLGIAVAGLALAVQFLFGRLANDLNEVHGNSAVTLQHHSVRMSNHTMFQDVFQWMEQHGANISKGIAVSSVPHGGISVRGLVSSSKISENENLVQVPKRLWFHVHNYPEIETADLSNIVACSEIGEDFLDVIITAAALALEAKKGNTSFYAPFFAYLPTLDEYRSFIPDMASDSIMQEFRSVHFVRHRLSRWRFELKTLRSCFEAWKRKPKAPAGISALDWDTDMQVARLHWQTRGYNSEKLGSIMVPLADLANARAGTGSNTWWVEEDDAFIVRSSHVIGVGSEVYEEYAKETHNADALYSWGMYFETNPMQQPPDSFDEESCTPDLRALVESILEDPQANKNKNLLAPRCKVSALRDQHQGPIRCSLARLSYETCSRFWS